MITQVIHNKTGNRYFMLNDEIINATNANDGQDMVLYMNQQGMYFVREKQEFWQKFHKLEQDDKQLLLINN